MESQLRLDVQTTKMITTQEFTSDPDLLVVRFSPSFLTKAQRLVEFIIFARKTPPFRAGMSARTAKPCFRHSIVLAKQKPLDTISVCNTYKPTNTN